MVVDEYVQARPAPVLRPYVAWYSGYRQAGIVPGTHRGLPSPYLTLPSNRPTHLPRLD
ncbi:hypothetical protein AB0J80_16335 [Actinoplanes sp. NPDC049548]|uniref:hypothetical protein n=1 Tax=Actinoplanes sp. NPDC049548 TaxID=3155152 RepID=UPI00344302C6